MTMEEELALIHGQAPAPEGAAPAAPAPAAATPAPDAPAPLSGPAGAPVEAMPPAFVPRALPYDLPPAETGLPALPQTGAGFWDVAAAGWKLATIRNPSFGFEGQKANDLAQEMFDMLPPDSQKRVTSQGFDGFSKWGSFAGAVVAEAQNAAKADPGPWGQMPLTEQDFNARIRGEVLDDLHEARTVLDQPGGGFAEFLGDATRSLTSPINLLTMPIGGPVAGSAWKFIGAEAMLGAAAEGVDAELEKSIAPRLGLPDPNIGQRMALGAAFGGAFAGLVKGVPPLWRKARTMAAARKASIEDATPEGFSALRAEAAISRAEDDLRGETGPRTQPRVQTDEQQGTLGSIVAGSTGHTYPGAAALPYNEGAVLRSIIGTESGGNASAQNPGSSARGLGQFISSTWLPMVRRYHPEIAAGKSDSEILSLRDDPNLNAEMTAMYARENAETLAASGVPVDPGTIYMAHFMGPGGAVRALRAAPDAPISSLMSPKEIAANAGIRFNGKRFAEFTAQDLRSWATRKMQAAYDPNALPDVPTFESARGYTADGQVSVGDNWRIDVQYEVVDVSQLTRATGPYQPRDSSGINSDAWIAETSARLDPAQLMRSPNAALGAPIVGPDGMIESGNGRVSVLTRAYEHHPDRAAAYRSAIEAEGFAIPEGVDRPVLIARRTTDLTEAERVRLTVDAQDSGIAVMTPVEMARVHARDMTSDRLALYTPTAELDDPANAGFVRGFLGSLPKAVRSAAGDGDNALNSYGRRLLREAVFARAWPEQELIELMTEGGQGELKSLMEALQRAAPDWALMRADVAAGQLAPEFDITGNVLDAMRMLVLARKIARRDKQTVGAALTDLLDSPDLMNGAISPLTTALIGKFWRGGRTAPEDEVAGFLTRYAAEARRASDAADGFFGAPTPREVLQAIDPVTFKALPEEIGVTADASTAPSPAPRAEEPSPDYDAGAASPRVQAEDQAARDALEAEATGPFGPVLRVFKDDWRAAALEMERMQGGEALDVLSHPEIGKISLPWGKPGNNDGSGFGLAKLIAWHPEVLDDLQGRIGRAHLISNDGRTAQLESAADKIGIRLDYDGVQKIWLVTAFEKGARREKRSSARLQDIWSGSTSPDPLRKADDIATLPAIQDAQPRQAAQQEFDIAAELAAARADLGDDLDQMTFDMPDGTTASAREMLDLLDQNAATAAVLRACAIAPGGAS